MASSRIQDYSVDLFKIKTLPGGDIILDVGGNAGKVTINGDLEVLGDQTSIGSTDLVVTDNTITVNSGETGLGVSLTTAGMIIDRGVFANANILFDENLTWYDSQTGLVDANLGAFVLKTGAATGGETGNTVGLYTNFLGTFNNVDLVFLGEGSNAKLSVTGTTDYESKIWSYDSGVNSPIPEDVAIPGKVKRAIDYDDDTLITAKALVDYVDSFKLYNFQNQINSPTPSGDTKVIVTDFDVSGLASVAEIIIDNTPVASFKQTKIQFPDIEFEDRSITVRSGNSNLELRGTGTGNVELHTPALMPKYVGSVPGDTEPTQPTDGVKLYTKEEADGGTGLFFVNENATRDEIISRNKALLYSIIF